MNHLKSINELFGINNILRNFKYSDEHEAVEIEIYIKRGKISDIKTSKINRSDFVVTKSVEFKIPSFDKDKVRVDFTNSLPLIKMPGTTDYQIYMNEKPIYCSRYISKMIFETLVKKYNLKF